MACPFVAVFSLFSVVISCWWIWWFDNYRFQCFRYLVLMLPMCRIVFGNFCAICYLLECRKIYYWGPVNFRCFCNCWICTIAVLQQTLCWISKFIERAVSASRPVLPYLRLFAAIKLRTKTNKFYGCFGVLLSRQSVAANLWWLSNFSKTTFSYTWHTLVFRD